METNFVTSYCFRFVCYTVSRPPGFGAFSLRALSFVLVCSGDEPSDCQSEHHRHVCIFLHATDASCRGGWHSYYVTWQHLWSVRLSHMARSSSTLVVAGYVDLRNSHHGIRALLRCHLPHVVQCKCCALLSSDSLRVWRSYVFNLLHAQVNSAPYPQRDRKWVVAYELRGESLVWLIGAVVCLLAAPRFLLLAVVGNKWPLNAPRCH